MNIWRPTKVEWATFYVMMPLLGIAVYYLMLGHQGFHLQTFIPAFTVIAAIGILSWYLHIISMHLLRNWLHEFRQTLLRLILLALCHFLLISATMAVYFYGFDAMGFLNYQFDEQNFRLSIVVGISLILITTSLWEGEYIFIRWKESLAEKELLQQIQLQHEFESLKSQVNPHFLFNCFNTLSSLISEDQQRAEKFLDELSKVYRYLLRNNEDGLSTVQKELQFIRSYFELLRSRYGPGVELKVEVDKKYESYLMPTSTLQLLVENAVKHNVISRQMPLVIDIFSTTGNKLIVNNNLQLKLVKAPSNKIGLENIKSKYDILQRPGFQVLQDDKNFTVVLPLLWSKATENHFSLTMSNE